MVAGVVSGAPHNGDQSPDISGRLPLLISGRLPLRDPDDRLSGHLCRPGRRHGGDHGLRRRPSQQPQHASVAQRIRLDPLKIEELGNAFVIGTK